MPEAQARRPEDFHCEGWNGPVLDGPWKGDTIVADMPTIPYVNSTGRYSFSKVAKGWYWIARDTQ